MVEVALKHLSVVNVAVYCSHRALHHFECHGSFERRVWARVIARVTSLYDFVVWLQECVFVCLLGGMRSLHMLFKYRTARTNLWLSLGAYHVLDVQSHSCPPEQTSFSRYGTNTMVAPPILHTGGSHELMADVMCITTPLTVAHHKEPTTWWRATNVGSRSMTADQCSVR